MDAAADIAEIRDRLSYNPETGEFHWLNSPRKRWVGKKAGCFDSITGYIRIGVAGKVRYAHRVAWAYVYGEWPDDEIDHLNCNRIDNRIANLRAANCGHNARNRRKTSRNISGFKGVSFNSKRGLWRAGIGFEGKRYNLGDFVTPEMAHAAYVKASHQLHGEFARAE